MLRAIFMLLLTVASGYADDAIEPAIHSAEQAVTRFHEARDAELKTSLTEEQNRTLAIYGESASSLRIEFIDQNDPLRLRGSDPVIGDSDPSLRFLGKFSDVVSSKNAQWRLTYGLFMGGQIVVHLDAVTKKILYICHLPEG